MQKYWKKYITEDYPPGFVIAQSSEPCNGDS